MAAPGSSSRRGPRRSWGRSTDWSGACEPLLTPLTRKLAAFSKVLTVVILGLAAVTFVIGLLRGHDAVEMFTAAIALAVGAIPEGLPAAVTITLAIGVSRMARRRAVIRRLPAVETLGSTTVICSDKTGTLTENQMTVRKIWTRDADVEVSGSGYTPEGTLSTSGVEVGVHSSEALRWCLLAGARCNDAGLVRGKDGWGIVGDPTEAAMLVVAAKAGLDQDELRAEYPRVATIPFSSERQYMATTHQDPLSAGEVVLLKGGVERVLALCGAQMTEDGSSVPLDHQLVLSAAQELAGRGLRVLATAMWQPAGTQQLAESALEGNLVLTGLQAMLDPARPAAASAVLACLGAGISVRMITGDHAATAAAVARDVGLLTEADGADAVVTGAEIASAEAGEHAELVARAKVFARVSPEQKLGLVRRLQAQGHVVAMTGDGVNDAPALHQADIGIAMGRSGTEVAKDAADMVLVDDDFATIEAAIEEGRGVFDNLTKFIAWTLPTNIGEGLVILVAIVLGSALPILPTQILWINMSTAVALGLMLAFEPKEPMIMTRRPRDPSQRLLGVSLVVRILLVSTLLVAGSWWLFEWEVSHGATLPEARTAAMNVFVVVEAFYLFSCRSLTRSAWSIGFFSNRWLVVGVVTQAVGQAAITYLPVMNTVFHTAPIDAGVWLRVLVIGALASVVVGAHKRLLRRRVVRRETPDGTTDRVGLLPGRGAEA